MKKVVKILLPIMCLNAAILSGCGEDNRIVLSFGDIHANDVTEIFYDQVQAKVDNKESFMLAISPDSGCNCWELFHPIIKNYIVENKLYCAHIGMNAFRDVAYKYNISLTSGATTFVIFNKGEAKVQLCSSAKDSPLESASKFKKFMDGNVKMPKIYFVNESDVLSMVSSGKNAVVYYERSECGDCSYLNPTIFEYYKKNNNYNKQNLYVLDCQPWKLLSNEEYQAKKDLFGISANINTVYGANIGTDQGVFPYLAYISEGKITSAAVAFNDQIKLENNKYVIADSYYTNERLTNLDYLDSVSNKVLKGMELPESDVNDSGSYIAWKKDKAIKYYQPIIESFLDSKLPNVNYIA